MVSGGCCGEVKARRGLGPKSVELERKEAGVAGKVGIRGENGPAARAGDRANQHVGRRNGYAPAAALIAEFSGIFKIRTGDGFIRKTGENFAQFLKLLRGLDAREQLLADDANDSSAAFVDQFGQFDDHRLFGAAQTPGGPAQGQRPHGGVHEDVQERLRERSRL